MHFRVQTCYTPTERYATRYVTVEECCPGWKDAGAGSCSIRKYCEGASEVLSSDFFDNIFLKNLILTVCGDKVL